MALEASDLRVSVEEQARWRRRMSVTVPATVVRQEEQRAAQRLAARAQMKGFRKGRVPSRILESRFGGALRREALDQLIGEAYRTALAEHALRPISEGQVEEIQYEPQADLSFSIVFDVEPVFAIERTEGFVVERPALQVSEEHVDQVLQRIREQAGAWKPEEGGAPSDGDMVSVTITKLDGDEAGQAPRAYEFVLGQGDALPDIEAALRTLEPGGSGEFAVRFPDDFPDESRRGESERIHLDLVSRKSLVLPPLDDDLARQVGPFSNIEELRTQVRADVERDARERSDAVVRGRLVELLLEANPFDVPLSMVDRYIDAVIGDRRGISDDKIGEIREHVRPEAERAVKRILLIDSIARGHGLAATDDDIDTRIQEIADANSMDPAKVYADLQKAGRIEALERELTDRKVFDFLISRSEIAETPSA